MDAATPRSADPTPISRGRSHQSTASGDILQVGPGERVLRPGSRAHELPRLMDQSEAKRLGIPADLGGSSRPFRLVLPIVPASFFGIVLGLAGLAGGWRAAHLAWGIPSAVGEALFALACAVWVIVTVLYASKWLTATNAALAEARHPIHCCFIGLAGVATMVMALGALPYSRFVAMLLFAGGVVFTLAFGIWRTGLLLRGGREIELSTPILFLPVVAGGFVTAASAAAFGWAEWAMLAFGGAFFSWLALESVILHRLYTGAPMPPALRPTLGIELAPPSVGALALLSVGNPSALFLAQLMVGYALLQALLLARLWPWVAEQPFAPSYWGLTFGATALPVSVMKMSAASPTHAFGTLGFVLFLASNGIVGLIAVRSIALLARRWRRPKATPAGIGPDQPAPPHSA